MAEVASAVAQGLEVHEAGAKWRLVGLPADRHTEPTALQEIPVGPSGQRAAQALARLVPDVTHIHGLWTPFEWRTARAARAVGSRLVFSPHGALEPWALASKAWKKKIAWLAYQRRDLTSADLIIVNSEQERRQLRALGLAGPIATIPNGIELSEWPQDLALGHAGARDRTVLFLGRLDPKKGIPDLLHALKLVERRRGFSLKIYGFGDAAYEAAIRRLIDSLGLTDVSMHPAVFDAEKWRTYASASVFVLPSYSENFGITVAEALYCGCAVITTTSTPWHQLADEGLGWIVSNDRAELANALQSAIDLNDAQRDNLAERARDYAAAHFTWKPLVERYATTYAWVCGRGPKPDWVEE